MNITLEAGEMAVAQMLASMRNAINRATRVGNNRVGPQSDYQTDLDGIVAEIAFAKWKNCFPDISISPRTGGHDVTVADKKVDIKATRYPNGKLLAVPSKTKNDADFYVLAIVADNSVKFAGFASANDLLSDENLTDLGHGPTYAMTQDRLNKFK